MKRILLIPARKQGCKAILLGPQRIDATEGLAVPDEATLVRGEQGGMPVTDGVFPDSKEFLLGYWIVDADSRARLRDSGTNFGGARTGTSADQYAD